MGLIRRRGQWYMPKRVGVAGSAVILCTTVALVMGGTAASASAASPNSAARLANTDISGTKASPGWVAQGALKDRPTIVPHMGEPATSISGARRGPETIPNVTSENWSGYIDTNYTKEGKFRNVAATWHVPEIPDNHCTGGKYGTRIASFWLGLDGAGDKTVEQTGTSSVCHDGTLSYFSWYEMYPSDSVEIGSVNPGDKISAYVDYTGKSYLLSIVDVTSGNYLSTLMGCPSGSSCLNESAEVIAESPGGCVASSTQVCRPPGTTLYQLPDFDYVDFNGISAATIKAGGSLASGNFGPENATMEDASSNILAQVTTLWNNDGFTDSWKAST
jgi:hypothetical protein